MLIEHQTGQLMLRRVARQVSLLILLPALAAGQSSTAIPGSVVELMREWLSRSHSAPLLGRALTTPFDRSSTNLSFGPQSSPAGGHTVAPSGPADVPLNGFSHFFTPQERSG